MGGGLPRVAAREADRVHAGDREDVRKPAPAVPGPAPAVPGPMLALRCHRRSPSRPGTAPCWQHRPGWQDVQHLVILLGHLPSYRSDKAAELYIMYRFCRAGKGAELNATAGPIDRLD